MTYLWQHTFAKIGEDWVFLALLGVMMAVISFVMDEGIDKCNAARRILYNEISGTSCLVLYLRHACRLEHIPGNTGE